MTELARTPFSAVWLDPERIAWFALSSPPGNEPNENTAPSATGAEGLLSRASRASAVQVVVQLRQHAITERADLPVERGVGPVMLLGAGRSMVALMSTSFSGEPHPIYRIDPGGVVKRIGQVPQPPRAAVLLKDAVLIACYDVGQSATLWRIPLHGGHARDLGALAPGLRPSLVVLEHVAYTVVNSKLCCTDGNTPLRPVPDAPQPLSISLFVVDNTLVLEGANGLLQWLPGGTSRSLSHRPTFPRAVTATDAGWVWLERAESNESTEQLRRWSLDGSDTDVLHTFNDRIGAAMMSHGQLLVSLQRGDSLFAPEYRIELKPLPRERPQSSQLPAEPVTSPLADEARQARREFFEQHFGRILEQQPPAAQISGAWPDGSLLELRGRGRFEGRIITVTSGLSDPDLPRRGVGHDLRQAPSLQGHAGYGLEIAIVTPEPTLWAAVALTALVRAQLRNRFLYVDVLQRFDCALETRVPLGDDHTINLILTEKLDNGPRTMQLPSGRARLVYAVVVPDSMMAPIQRAGPKAALTYLGRHGTDPTTER